MVSQNKSKLNAVHKSNLLTRRLLELEQANARQAKSAVLLRGEVAAKASRIRSLQQDVANAKHSASYAWRTAYTVAIVGLVLAIIQEFV